ncbi:DUF4349 domain-containing protein [Serinicoccus kebangsaanensis]|uniref:DUF4349 domain-containing protein n=1 Tax=Serinicoccus kebangsaanensis TaxID=2602069 RepID=UPI00124CBF3E|nr:DUF4349 domain-containing protein [Serinicoccus kebangsaanensis]
MTARLMTALVAMVLLLAGCSADGSGGSDDSAAEAASSPGGEADGGDAASEGESADGSGEESRGAAADLGPTVADGEAPLMVRSVELEMVVEDVAAAVTRARATTTGAGGFVSSEDVSPATGTRTGYGSLVLRVPAADLDQVVTSLSELGEVRASRSNADDVTAEYRDVEARIATMEAGATRLRELVAEAANLEDIAALERELTDREAELDALKARMQVLSDDVARSTITLHLAEESEDLDEVVPDTGFVAGLSQGWSAFTTSVTMLLTALGALLPFLVLAAAVLVPALVWHRRRRAASTPDRETIEE